MAKRSTEETYSKDSNSEFKYDNSEDELRKKINLETDLILDKVQEIEQEIDIREHEVRKLLLIFHTLVQTINCGLKKLQSLFIPQTKDSEEGNQGDPEPENGQDTNETQETNEACRKGREKQ